MAGKDFVVLPAQALPRFNARNMPPGKSKNTKSVGKIPPPSAPKERTGPGSASKAVKRTEPATPPARTTPAPAQTEGPPRAAAAETIRDRKNAVRREMREKLLKMRGRVDRSAKICDAIASHSAWRRATIVAIFAPMETEPDVELLWKQAEGRTICYPTIRKGGLDFMGVGGPDSVAPGQFGIREPVFDHARVIPPDTFDLILVPGAAFTADGERLGRGGGFYDRVLSSPGFRAFKVGVCFDRQVLESLPTEPHDQRVHRVVTELGFLQRPEFVKAGKPAA
jgi:5-formyltetrahydrofolate cyclo-ligase